MDHIQNLLLLQILQLLIAAGEMQILICLTLLRLVSNTIEDCNNLITAFLQSKCPNCLGDDDGSKKFWVKPHKCSWWDFVNGRGNLSGEMSELDFISNFRVSRQLFYEIVEQLSPAIAKKDTKFRMAIPVEKRVAISLFVLSSCGRLQDVASLFGVGLTTVHEIFDDYIDAASQILVPKYIKWPTTSEEIKLKARKFETIKKFPMVLAAINGCYIPVTPLKTDATEYYNFKGWYLVVTMALCDASGRALYVKTGSPGRCHDSAIFRGTNLYRKIIEGTLFPESSRIINGVKIPYLILGDSAFRLTTWLMKPYVHSRTLSASQKEYNERLSGARVAVEHLFGRLKGRWRRITKRMEVDIHRVAPIVNVAFALHNMCESRNVYYSNTWQEDDDDAQPDDPLNDAILNPNATEIQDALRLYFDTTQ